ncbi:MAG: hypothetical protein A4E71_02973 [Smithella sp. PtaU1.Bin162]|nr:MAG: hypothetical protein A4E71_02973 [Smithella sp. PtaU1.Bin162]
MKRYFECNKSKLRLIKGTGVIAKNRNGLCSAMLESIALNKSRVFYKLYFLIIASLLIFIIFLGSVDENLREFFIQEDGIVENLSVIGYFACVFFIFRAFGSEAEKFWDFMILLSFLAMRELDFHNRFTSMSVTKTSFFTSNQIPLAQKIFVIFCGFPILYCIVRILRNHYRSFIISVKKLEPSAVCILTGLAFIFISLFLDGLTRKMLAFNIDVDPVITGVAESAEEVLELGIPIMFAMSLKPFFDIKKRAAFPSTSPPHIP